MSNEFARNNYLNLGQDGIPTSMNPSLTRDLLDRLGFERNPYTLARVGNPFDITKAGLSQDLRCKFCHRPLIGVEYDRMADGGARCSSCARTMITSIQEFKALFEKVKLDMQRFYGVEVKSHINVSMVSPNKIEKVCGGSGALGVAVDRGNKKNLLLENGAPIMPALSTMMHELTHIWQYENWNRNEIAYRYSNDVVLHADPDVARTIVYEGMAVWAETQYMLLLGETEYAHRYIAGRLNEASPYGVGLALYFKKYGFSDNAFIDDKTPFNAGNEPLG